MSWAFADLNWKKSLSPLTWLTCHLSLRMRHTSYILYHNLNWRSLLIWQIYHNGHGPSAHGILKYVRLFWCITFTCTCLYPFFIPKTITHNSSIVLFYFVSTRLIHLRRIWFWLMVWKFNSNNCRWLCAWIQNLVMVQQNYEMAMMEKTI